MNGEFITEARTLSVKRPQMIEQFYSSFSVIDVHDHYRQGSLGMEREWYTHSWWHRIVGTIFGMCIVDSYMTYKYEMSNGGKEREIIDFNKYIMQLSHQLIFNIFLEDSITLRDRLDSASTTNKVRHSFLLRIL